MSPWEEFDKEKSKLEFKMDPELTKDTSKYLLEEFTSMSKLNYQTISYLGLYSTYEDSRKGYLSKLELNDNTKESKERLIEFIESNRPMYGEITRISSCNICNLGVLVSGYHVYFPVILYILPPHIAVSIDHYLRDKGIRESRFKYRVGLIGVNTVHYHTIPLSLNHIRGIDPSKVDRLSIKDGLKEALVMSGSLEGTAFYDGLRSYLERIHDLS